MTKKTLVVVVGPTAVGKTAVCIEMALHYKTEIISADSRQFYREMNIGTAKPSPDELEKIPHHLIDHLSIHQKYTVKDFEEEALKQIAKVHESSDVAILTGGSGLYVKAICEGLDEMPDVPPSFRESLMKEWQEKGLDYLLQELQRFDPEYFNLVDQSNPQRIIRALEVTRFTGNSYSSFRKKEKVLRPFKIIKVGLKRDREELYTRIDHRMNIMIQNGLFKEAELLFPYRELNALQTVGYSEIFDYMENKYDEEEAIRLLKRNSRRYAKRQMTWFNREQEIKWFKPDNISGIIRFIEENILL